MRPMQRRAFLGVSFVVTPQVEGDVGYNDNVLYTQSNKKSSSFLEVLPSVEVASDWGRNALSLGATSRIDEYDSASSEDTVTWDVNAAGRLDISSAANLAANLSHESGFESRSDFVADPDAKKPMPMDTNSASANLTWVGDRLRLQGGLATSNVSYGTVASVNGGIIDDHFRDMTEDQATGRVDYAISPSVSVFIYGEANQRRYKIDPSSNSDGQILSVGTSFEIGSLARGEVELGSLNQNYKSLVGGNQSSTYFNGKVQYFPTELTTLTATANRSYSDTPSVTGGYTALNTQLGFAVDHELLRNLILKGAYEHSSYDFSGISRNDTANTVSLGARYYMNSRIYLKVGYDYEKYKSTGAQASRNFTDNAVRIGIVASY